MPVVAAHELEDLRACPKPAVNMVTTLHHHHEMPRLIPMRQEMCPSPMHKEQGVTQLHAGIVLEQQRRVARLWTGVACRMAADGCSCLVTLGVRAHEAQHG